MILRHLLFTFLVLSINLPSIQAVVSCTSNEECEKAFLPGSTCEEFVCTNPFHNGGCLGKFLPEYAEKVRVCHSEDTPEAKELGHCRTPSLEYMEVRVLSLDWESAIMQAWILQIILSELLDIPVTVETGIAGTSDDFYHVDSVLTYGDFDPLYKPLQLSSRVPDCRTLYTNDPKTYQSCAHYVPEVWEGYQFQQANVQGTGPLRVLGMLGEQHWYIPRFTAQRDPSLTSYFGLWGEDNRQKLAELFKRPTTWKDYCEDVSNDGCTDDDGVAFRAPADEDEGAMFFADGLFTGHFRATNSNNCTMNPTTCTGHFADYPCGWATYAAQQIHHLGIALQSNGPDPSGGYSFTQLTQIWKAANATKSDVMMMWWSPEALKLEFHGTDAEFVKVILSEPTQECTNSRLTEGALCSESFDVTTTDPKGSCDYSAYPVDRLIGDGLYDATYNADIPQALQSPAFVAMENFQMTSLQIGEIFNYWNERDVDFNFDARYATCRWVAENIDAILESVVPKSYPRTVQEQDTTRDPLVLAARILGGVATFLVIIAFSQVALRRNTKIMFYAQVDFMNLILGGLLLMSISALVLANPRSDEMCTSILWLANLGYALHLTPLVARIFAINTLANSGKHMHRVRLTKHRLFGWVAGVLALVGGFSLAWTLVDPPAKAFSYQVTDQVTDDGETIVVSSDWCASDSNIWLATFFTWQAALLLPGSIIAFVASRVREDMNDTRSLGIVLYSHIVFLVLRSLVYLLREGSELSAGMAYQSLLTSANVIAAILIYILPKFLAKEEEMKSEMLPDLFLNASVMVADVQGFAAWSSGREPVHVFKLLELLYGAFDEIATQKQVFKVETVRDCYVAATGIPKPEPKHAEIIVKFAGEVLKKMDHLSKKLEMMFGPDTADLTLRAGIHSGPVTGGFLKGKGSRFQLFGDTMTTACLIQTTSESNRVHLSQATAELLIEAGHKRWIQKRGNPVKTEEKGELETYWLTRGIKRLGKLDNGYTESSEFNLSGGSDGSVHNEEILLDTEERWINWNVDVLATVLKDILTQRETGGLTLHAKHAAESAAVLAEIVTQKATNLISPVANAKPDDSTERTESVEGATFSMPLDEVAEIIELPKFDKRAAMRQRDNAVTEINTETMSQLKEFVTHIAGMYNNNPFHNFAHASYVVMAVSKYMNRIIAASEIDLGFDDDRQRTSTYETLHDHTYGITSDPLTRFACVFSALIHDIDHPGVPNPQFIRENEHLAGKYKNRSVAEQNSFNLAWDLLMNDSFTLLRTTICADDAELQRFRQLVVNSVMATDLGDKEMKALRNGRWEKAFDGNSAQEEDPRDAKNRKATIVIEHLIQAADIAHTCQHWTIYRKWNERLFHECYRAYVDGRAETNPADGWYKGELGFYDFYIIPLAKKLRDCGVFGPTSDENLDYAKNNRAMWEKEGESITAEMRLQAELDYSRRSLWSNEDEEVIEFTTEPLKD